MRFGLRDQGLGFREVALRCCDVCARKYLYFREGLMWRLRLGLRVAGKLGLKV